VALCFAGMAALMVPVSLFGVHEARLLENTSFYEYVATTWATLRSKAFFYVVLWQFLNPAIQYVASTATPNVTQYWAGVSNLAQQAMQILGYMAFSWALYMVREHFLHVSWRKMLVTTTVTLVAIDVPFSMLTIFDVVRNQYFYLGETFLTEIPDGVNFVVATFVIVEMADGGNEGLVYGLLTTTYNLGSPFGRAVANTLYSSFTPSLDEPANYIADTPAFRSTVAGSFLLSYFFAFAAQLTLLLLPRQKEEAQRRKRQWARSDRYAAISISIVSVALVYSLTINFLSIGESTSCLRIVGGSGCEPPEDITDEGEDRRRS